MNTRAIRFIRLLALAGLLASCETPEREVVYRGEPEPLPPEEAELDDPGDAPDDGPPPDVRRTMIIADLLFEARGAFEDNRLLYPASDNAFDRYLEVLGLDPGNEVAAQGIRDIVERYVQLADNDIRLGQYDNAAEMLARAASIDPDSEMVAAGRARLEEARRRKTEFHALDAGELDRQSVELISRLGEIARQLQRESEATFLIIARSDAEGRWIYKIMREAVGGRRLRGNIAIGGEPGVRIQYPPPQAGDEETQGQSAPEETIEAVGAVPDRE